MTNNSRFLLMTRRLKPWQRNAFAAAIATAALAAMFAVAQGPPATIQHNSVACAGETPNRNCGGSTWCHSSKNEAACCAERGCMTKAQWAILSLSQFPTAAEPSAPGRACALHEDKTATVADASLARVATCEDINVFEKTSSEAACAHAPSSPAVLSLGSTASTRTSQSSNESEALRAFAVAHAIRIVNATSLGRARAGGGAGAGGGVPSASNSFGD